MIERHKIEDFKGGWFIGDFDPSLHKTSLFEASIKTHPKGEKWEKHYHKIAMEYNCVVSGKVVINGETYGQGDIFVVHPGTVVDPEFPEDCVIACVKVPSVKGDKYVC